MMFDPIKSIQDEAHVKSMDEYRAMYEESIENPERFWGEIAKQFYWKSPPQPGQFLQYNIDVRKGPVSIKWMDGAITNICYNVLDRNIEKGLGENVAFYWEGNEPGDEAKITYNDVLRETCKIANVLKAKGVQKGDRVCIYLPMVPYLVYAMLACARIGVIHSIVFGGYSSAALGERILDAKAKVLITADGVFRATKLINLKEIADGALKICESKNHEVDHCIVLQHLTGPENGPNDNDPPAKRPCHKLQVVWNDKRDVWWHNVVKNVSESCDVEWMNAEDPLFMLYTSGSTGKPKGVLHTVAGYMLYTATTFKYTFDYKPGDVYFCTADIGWITGHSYVVYGPMANGATSVLFEGVPTYPDPSRFWTIVDKYRVNSFYTAPTAIRALMKAGDDIVKKSSRNSLRILGTVGEPINPEAWLWYHKVVGENKCAIVDTFWQTETGGHVLTPLPGCTPTKPGSATFPFFGIIPKILDDNGKEIEGAGEGYLVFTKPWPGIMRTVYGNHERYETTYFKKFEGYYCTGDGARRDEDGYLWVTGRIDDMLNVSGHLLSTAEIESALIEHPAVVEAAVVSRPHDVKGEATYCFVTLADGHTFDENLVKELKIKVRSKIGPFASPENIQEAPGLPKTRSGKIMRRILRKIARGVNEDLGDISTLADPAVIDVLFNKRKSAL
ncbi:acetyl-coenzyme A synthetase, cytoplasmic-like [Tubulanus polymorphus]|uniref:acetyl-coenzyme A synthetase, cytoplasmic-like n=1 Tax=Tubulanus polymorphus TaxID=672921 RepID=UPI003DA2B61A